MAGSIRSDDLFRFAPGNQPLFENMFQIPMLDKPLGELHTAEGVGEGFYFFRICRDVFILVFFEPARCDETSDLLQFSGIEPDPVMTANVDENAGDRLEILPGHQVITQGAVEITTILRKGLLAVFSGNRCVGIDVSLGCDMFEFIGIEPDPGTSRTNVDLDIPEFRRFHRNPAAGAAQLPISFFFFYYIQTTEGTSGQGLVERLTAVWTGRLIIHDFSSDTSFFLSIPSLGYSIQSKSDAIMRVGSLHDGHIRCENLIIRVQSYRVRACRYLCSE